MPAVHSQCKHKCRYRVEVSMVVWHSKHITVHSEDKLHQTSTTRAQLSLKNCPMLVHTSVSAVKSCPQVSDSKIFARFPNFYLSLSHLTPSMNGIPSSYRVHIWYGKTRMAGLESADEAQYIDVTDRQQCHRSKCHANVLHWAAKTSTNK